MRACSFTRSRYSAMCCSKKSHRLPTSYLQAQRFHFWGNAPGIPSQFTVWPNARNSHEVRNEIVEAIDALSNARLDAKGRAMQQLEGAALEAFHTLLKGHPRPWQGLSRATAR